MKRVLAISAVLMLFYTVLIDGQFNTSSLLNGNGPRVCILNNCNYFAVSPVCGRYGGSNLCKNFNNSCLLRYDACVNSVSYTTVSTSMCSGIPVGQRRQCVGSSSTSTGSSGSANVIPIIIRRRRTRG